MSFIWSIPTAVLIAAAMLIVLINRGRANIGAAWFASILAALFVWGWTVSLYWQTDIPGMRPAEAMFSASEDLDTEAALYPAAEESSRYFVLDRVSYPYLLTVSVLLVVLLLTAPSYMEPKTAPRLWFFYLLIEAIGYLSVSASDISFVIYGWVIFDGIDLITQYLQVRPGKIRRGYVTAIGVRFIGTILAAASAAYSAVDPGLRQGSFISGGAGIFLLTACALRMGIFPITQPYSEMQSSRVGLGTMLRLAAVLTVMPVMSRIPMTGISHDLIILLTIASGFASLTGAVGWLLSESASAGSSYAALAISGMAFACTLSGDRFSMIAWGVSAVLTCAPLSLYQIHNGLMHVLGILVVICFSGLPYTPNAVGWNGLVRWPYTLKDLLFILVSLILTAGAFIHMPRTEGKKFSDLEPWMRSVYPLGFLAAILTHVFIGLISYGQWDNLGVIPASSAAFAGGVLLALFLHRLPEGLRTQNLIAWGRESVSFFWRVMKKLLDLDWLTDLGLMAAGVVRRLVFTVSAVLEHNGGLIWEFLLLALLIAAAFSGDLR